MKRSTLVLMNLIRRDFSVKTGPSQMTQCNQPLAGVAGCGEHICVFAYSVLKISGQCGAASCGRVTLDRDCELPFYFLNP